MKEIDITLEGIYKEDENIRKAREKAMVYLSYSDHTVKSMYKKLSENGFKSDEINEVLEYLVDRGYINEKDYFLRFCRYCAEKKGFGKTKILAQAYEKGFSKAQIHDIIDIAFENIDFFEICKREFLKLKVKDIGDRRQRDKAIASLMRRGFSLSEIKKAIGKDNED